MLFQALMLQGEFDEAEMALDAFIERMEVVEGTEREKRVLTQEERRNVETLLSGAKLLLQELLKVNSVNAEGAGVERNPNSRESFTAVFSEPTGR